MYYNKTTICECGGIGRRARLRGVFERVWVQVPPLAPKFKNPNKCVRIFFIYNMINPGVIVDEGTFDELFERNKVFKSMFLAENI